MSAMATQYRTEDFASRVLTLAAMSGAPARPMARRARERTGGRASGARLVQP
jgi:hypothetical protein